MDIPHPSYAASSLLAVVTQADIVTGLQRQARSDDVGLIIPYNYY
jgi:hypothetical protein